MGENVRMKKIYSLFIFVTLALGVDGLCLASDGGAFAKLNFGGNTYIEIPRNWKYLEENLRKHLNTSGEAVTRLAGFTPNPGENVILIAGNAYTSSRTPSATLRLSVRRGDGPTQVEMRQLAKLSKMELLLPVAEETRRVMTGIEGVKSVKVIDTRVATSKGMVCMFFEFETDASEGVKLSQIYVCPLGSRSVKLSTSYRKSEAMMFRPVIEYVWQSLRVN